MRARGDGVKNPKFLWTSLMEASTGKVVNCDHFYPYYFDLGREAKSTLSYSHAPLGRVGVLPPLLLAAPPAAARAPTLARAHLGPHVVRVVTVGQRRRRRVLLRPWRTLLIPLYHRMW